MTLCLDPSLRAYGWAIINKGDIIAGGCIRTKPGKPYYKSDITSAIHIAQELKRIILEHKPDLVLIETPIGSKSSRGSVALNLVKGITLALCVVYDKEFRNIVAKEVKSKNTGNINASKDEILKKVKQKYKSFDTIIGNSPKVVVYAVSDAAALCIEEN